MIRDITLTVTETDPPQRLDLWVLARLPSSSRRWITDAIAAGRILLNGTRAAKGSKPAPGDVVQVIELLESADWRAAPDPSVPLTIIHDDEVLLVVDKPAGMPVHPLTPWEKGTLVGALLAAHPELSGIGPDPMFPAVAHRLDADTSGVMLVARTSDVYAHLRTAFRERRIHKHYVALVRGEVARAGRLVHELVHGRGPKHRMVVVSPSDTPREQPMRAITDYSPLRSAGGATLLNIRILTGVTHQIRCQLAAAGHPILGDALYGPPPDAPPLPAARLMLHAAAIELNHPRTGQPVRYESPLPPEFAT